MIEDGDVPVDRFPCLSLVAGLGLWGTAEHVWLCVSAEPQSSRFERKIAINSHTVYI